ncbi:uncharacterized protein LOC124410929 [Diprion similis]|uniref:uncharacterized protein LOC124410929 n=1 Tax=Diprion similis TaxID=362088 RepID=UPI001EF81975|nr:uncharacterized protein LOC124410929 [Diprion similis]
MRRDNLLSVLILIVVCSLLASHASTIRNTIDMMGAVESAQKNNAPGSHGGREVNPPKDSVNTPPPQHQVAVAGPSLIRIVAGPGIQTIFYSIPGSFSISYGSPGTSTSYLVPAGYPGEVSLPGTLIQGPNTARQQEYVNYYKHPAYVAASRNLQAASQIIAGIASAFRRQLHVIDTE